ncbi:MAG: hypothetical protein ABH950_02385 [Candidatus Altiarchaeota archaeon]
MESDGKDGEKIEKNDKLDAWIGDWADIVNDVRKKTVRIENPLATDIISFWAPLNHLSKELSTSHVYSGVPRQLGSIDIPHQKGLYSFKFQTGRTESSPEIKALADQTGLVHPNIDLDRTPAGNLWRISVGGWDEYDLSKVVVAIHKLAEIIFAKEKKQFDYSR